MSPESVDVVRRFLWAFEHDRDAFRELLHPDIEWVPFEENHSPVHGVEGAMRVRDQWLDTWATHQLELVEVTGRGNDVVASVHIVARGKRSGVDVDVHLYLHYKVRDGKIAYLFEHEERTAAFEAAALEE